MEKPRPEVTVRDPRRPELDRPAPQPGAAPPSRRRWLGAGVAALVAAAGVLVVADVARDRRAAVEERRLDGVVDVALGQVASGWSSSYDAATRTGTLAVVLLLHNRGPRDVEVTTAELAGARFEGALDMAARSGSAALLLTRTLSCPADGTPPPPEPEGARLLVGVRTAAGPRDVVLEGGGLPIGSFNEQVRRACGFPPLHETVSVTGAVVDVQDRTATVRVDLRNEGRQLLHLTSIVPARGLEVLVSDPLIDALPIPLPPTSGRSAPVRSLQVQLGVSCSAILATDPLGPFEQVQVLVEDDSSQRIAQVSGLLRDDERRLRQFAGRVCGLG